MVLWPRKPRKGRGPGRPGQGAALQSHSLGAWWVSHSQLCGLKPDKAGFSRWAEGPAVCQQLPVQPGCPESVSCCFRSGPGLEELVAWDGIRSDWGGGEEKFPSGPLTPWLLSWSQCGLKKKVLGTQNVLDKPSQRLLCEHL